jgi:hypothetical protein
MELRGAPKPAVNARYVTDIGEVEVDLSWPDLMICVEVDGPTHDDDEQQAVDRRNRSALRRAGWDVYVIHWRDYGESVVASTEEAFRAVRRRMLSTFPTLSVGNVDSVEGGGSSPNTIATFATLGVGNVRTVGVGAR